MDTAQLTRLIKAQAHALGFQAVGIIPAEPFQNGEGERLKHWLEQGYQAEMQWMVTHLEKRLDPASLMENTRSIVCVAMNYYTPDELNPHPDAVKIAKYARGTDYHYVLKDRLKALLKQIQAQVPNVSGRALTDSAPILEKPLAVKAGLGWMGKHGNVILPKKGSWYFLGELLLDIPLIYDTKQVPNQCGSCTRCIDACPTGAITEPMVVDTNRCISYWTIEYKGENFSEEIAQNLQGWVFGCDICQDVCPWNLKFAQPTEEAEFQSRAWNKSPHANEILDLSEEEFRERYRKSPVKRTKLRGLLRNVREAHPKSRS